VGSRSLAEYAIIAIAPELAPASLASLWDKSTLAESLVGKEKEKVERSDLLDVALTTRFPHRRGWKKWLCLA
jgi:hypothetical protein